MPSVRGWERAQVVTVLVAAATMTAAGVGFVAGVAWNVTGATAMSAPIAAGLVAVAAVLDRIWHPPSVRRQVPQAWGRLFPPVGAALLYGARLGPGPLTVLNTWLWWSAIVVAATLGPWGASLVSGVFGVGRIGVMLVAGSGAGRWRRWERPAGASIAGLVVASLALVLVTSTPAGRPPVAAASPSADADRAPAPRQPSTSSTSVPHVPADVAADLSSRLPVEAGAGLARLPDDPADGLGPLDLGAAAAVEPDASAERSLLETRSFEAGHARAWKGPDGRTAYTAVYRFATESAARAYQRDGAITLEGRGVRQYPIDAPAGALGFSDASDGHDGGRVTHGVAFVSGRHFVLVLTTSRSSEPGGQHAARALALATSALQSP